MCKMKEQQIAVKDFDEARGWSNDWNVKDLCLNMSEEIGELWNLIKWVNDDKQREIVEKNKEEVSDFVGDALFLILKIANQTGVDAETALKNSLKDYEKRMPADEIKKVGHANKLAGGFDSKNG